MITYFVLDYNPDHHERGVEMLQHTVEYLYRNRDPRLGKTTYMINQGGSAEHRDWHREQQRIWNYSLIDLESNAGISRAINMMARLCRTPIMCLVTSDALFTKGCDEDAVNLLSKSDICQVSPYSQQSDAAHQVFVPAEEFGADTVTTPDDGVHDCIACELTIRFYDVSLFDKIGYMDERWKAGFESRDFCLRALMADQRSVVSHGSFCWHYGHGCYQTGAIERAYEDYIPEAQNGGGSDQTRALWNEKWPGVDGMVNFLGTRFTQDLVQTLKSQYKDNIYLSYVQGVGY